MSYLPIFHEVLIRGMQNSYQSIKGLFFPPHHIKAMDLRTIWRVLMTYLLVINGILFKEFTTTNAKVLRSFYDMFASRRFQSRIVIKASKGSFRPPSDQCQGFEDQMRSFKDMFSHISLDFFQVHTKSTSLFRWLFFLLQKKKGNQSISAY